MMADDSYETVAITYGQPETAVMLSMLTFYGIPAYALGSGHASVIPTWMVAFGGLQIRVHPEALDDARSLLAEIAQRPQAVRPLIIPEPILNGIIAVLSCFLGLMPVPPTRTGSTFFLGDRE